MLSRELEPEFTVELLEPEPGYVNLLASRSFDSSGRTLLLCGHLDVVPAAPGRDQWAYDPWAATIVDGKLYGRGSLDMKGPLAAIVAAARGVVAANLPSSGRIVIAAVADEEEGGLRGAGALVAAHMVKADGAVIAEPSDAGICLAHRGMCFVELTTHGRSAHASMPDAGDNAVERMVDVLTTLRTVQFTHTPHQLVGSPTISIGTTIGGGHKPNVVPDRCQATLDIRKVPGMTDRSVIEDLQSHLRRSGVESDAVDVKVLRSGEAAETDPEAYVVEIATAAYEREFGHVPNYRGMVAATDGWWFANCAAVPTIMALGPGSIAGCHIVDEHVDLNELEAYARVYADIIVSFLSQHSQHD